MAERKLEVTIIGDASSLERALGRAGKQTSAFSNGLRQASFVAIGAFAAIGLAAKIGFDELSEGQEVAAQTNAALKSTGGIANVTAKHVDELAQAQSRLTGIDDELVQAGENLLLTFKNVRNEVGRGNDVFDRATKSALDLSRAGFGSVQSASKMLGKALNDPIKGMTALSRAGVTFSEAQKKTIKQLVETGHALDAQKLILREVESQVGGSAKAWGDTLPGKLAKAQNAFKEMAANLTASLVPALTSLANIVSRASAFMSEHQTLVKALVLSIAGLAGAVLAVNIGLKVYAAAQVAAAAATGVWTAAQWLLNAALTANPIGVVVVALAALVAGVILAWKHSETFRNIVTGAFNAVRGAAEAVFGFFRDHWKLIAILISGPFAPLVALATDAFGIRSALVGAFNAVKSWVSSHWPEIAALISGPFFPIVAFATDAFGVRSAMISAFNAIKEAVVSSLQAIIATFRWLAQNTGRIWNAVLDGITAPVESAIALFQRLYDIVMGVRGVIRDALDQLANIKLPSLPSFGIPGRQHGGPVAAGSPYVVGEAGPELFVPRSAGKIVPNGGSVGSSAGAVYLTVNFPNYLGDANRAATQIQNLLLQKQRRGGTLGFS